MAKASDLIGRSGAGGFVPQQKKSTVPALEPEGDALDSKHPKGVPHKDLKPTKGGKNPAGGGSGASTVRPKV